VVFGLGNIVIDHSRPKDPKESKYCSNTAMTLGKPALTIESGGMGLSDDESEIAAIERGALNLMRHLKMLDGKVEMPPRSPGYDPAEVLYFPTTLQEKAGLFFASGEEDTDGLKKDLCWRGHDFFGRQIYELSRAFRGGDTLCPRHPSDQRREPLAFVAAVKNE